MFTDQELDPSESYDSGTHGTHVAGIAAGSGGGQVDPTTGEKYVGGSTRCMVNQHLSML